jgi:hypothetical protein
MRPRRHFRVAFLISLEKITFTTYLNLIDNMVCVAVDYIHQNIVWYFCKSLNFFCWKILMKLSLIAVLVVANDTNFLPYLVNFCGNAEILSYNLRICSKGICLIVHFWSVFPITLTSYFSKFRKYSLFFFTLIPVLFYFIQLFSI